jgi:deazaflavin-dependent oxidoreductase (nitroreductase family)
VIPFAPVAIPLRSGGHFPRVRGEAVCRRLVDGLEPLRIRVGGDADARVPKGGAPQQPVWYHNVKAHPVVEVSTDGRPERYIAREAEDHERARLWTPATRLYSGFEDSPHPGDRARTGIECDRPVVVFASSATASARAWAATRSAVVGDQCEPALTWLPSPWLRQPAPGPRRTRSARRPRRAAWVCRCSCRRPRGSRAPCPSRPRA